ncbi:MAG TPA: NAD+ synthase [Dehalococcoidia bacterium]|nr:NAD+ synthase [Dehalococcoidia bacterium]
MLKLRVALAQINTTVGDLSGNAERIRAEMLKARDLGADVVCFPELAVTGYPPEDLLLRRRFVDENIAVTRELAFEAREIVAVYGFVDADDDIYNAAAVAAGGQLVDVYHKQYLPNYGVFDEERYFRAGRRAPVYEIGGVLVGVNICEDIWYPGGPSLVQSFSGAEVLLNINGSPFAAGKLGFREKMLATRASDNVAVVCYVNLVGGQDELVFDGGSMVLNERAELISRARQFREALLVVDLDVGAIRQSRLHDTRRRKERLEFLAHTTPELIRLPSSSAAAERHAVAVCITPALEPVAEVYEALVLGTHDYVHKNGFADVVIGLSGGIDSSLTACVAVDALGAEHVTGISMPSRYSSPGSREDAAELAGRLGIRYITLPIEDIFSAYLATLGSLFDGTEPGLAEENLQTRARGNLLMALSNKFGWAQLVLTTGNKSEFATGYTTLYGDMAGGFAVLKDVPKSLVYSLSEHRNLRSDSPIPRAVLDKPPSAELRAGQKDVDSLPPYEILDPILEAYVEEDRAFDEIVAMGFDPETVRRTIDLVNRSEYKRRQAPPGVKVTTRAFGRDRRLPIANRYRAE